MRKTDNHIARISIKNKMITDIVNKIKLHFRPKKIILFGSYAWGKPNEDSDIDLFVIMESDLRRDERSCMIQKLFSDRTFPLDIIVYTPKEVKESLNRGNPFIEEILTRGALVHG
ncbi:MAG: nucleotidyltransferase domain-containing protein [Candidatus Aminicenantales bacterium]